MIKSSRGFTLIEMLIVIAVISILAGIVLVGITGFQESARDTKRIGDMRSIQNSLELFFTRCGHYPVDGNGCVGGASGSGVVTWSNLGNSLVAAGVVSSNARVLNDPQASATRNYEYAYGNDGYSYVVKATLEGRNSAMNDELELDDGDTTFGLDCADEAPNYGYCITSD